MQDADFLVASAARAIASIKNLAEVKEDGEPIDTNVGSLRSMALVMEGLTNEVVKCGGEECYGRAVNGCKTWVRTEQLSAAKARMAVMEQRLSDMEAALRRVAEAAVVPTQDFAFFCDWNEIARSQQSIASLALENAAMR